MTEAVPQPAPVDLESLAAILEEAGVRTEIEDPSLADYWGHLFEMTLGRIFKRLARVVEGVADSFGALGWLGQAALIVSLLALALLLARQFVLWRRRRRSRPAVEADLEVEAIPSETLEDWTPARWRQEVERYLDAGNIPAALAQTWWWLAATLRGTLRGGQVDRSWTSRELVLRAKRRDLLTVANDLDRLAFGPGPTASAEVRRFVLDAEARLR